MSTSLTDFNSAVDKLESTGKNWLTFHQRLQIAVCQKKVWKHFDGMSPHSTPADLDAVKAAEQAANITFTKHHRKGTVATIWSAITQEFSQKSMLLHANLRTQFLNMRSTPGANLYMELDRLRMHYEELQSLDLEISDAEYTSCRDLGSSDRGRPKNWGRSTDSHRRDGERCSNLRLGTSKLA
ncbi:hypothetical protein IEO21_10017 [Rhodonia placenta]|uniref:Uncharacterized protein n=1 Tax=Rhodonia placenta TaxID=104341 RepID=A0A8H7NTD5_9APHY|nr:hypothetical protein IEO21_10017 [Postia placenta]